LKIPKKHFEIKIKKDPLVGEPANEKNCRTPLKLNDEISRHISSHMNLKSSETSTSKKEKEDKSILEKNHIQNVIPLLKRMNIKDNRIVKVI